MMCHPNINMTVLLIACYRSESGALSSLTSLDRCMGVLVTNPLVPRPCGLCLSQIILPLNTTPNLPSLMCVLQFFSPCPTCDQFPKRCWDDMLNEHTGALKVCPAHTASTLHGDAGLYWGPMTGCTSHLGPPYGSFGKYRSLWELVGVSGSWQEFVGVSGSWWELAGVSRR